MPFRGRHWLAKVGLGDHPYSRITGRVPSSEPSSAITMVSGGWVWANRASRVAGRTAASLWAATMRRGPGRGRRRGRLVPAQQRQGLHEDENQQSGVIADVSQADRPREHAAGPESAGEQTIHSSVTPPWISVARSGVGGGG